MAASAEAELVSGDPVALPEEAAGKLRSAAGKAKLLASQKMQQFEGLCQKNIVRILSLSFSRRIFQNRCLNFLDVLSFGFQNQVPGEEFPTTNEDLAGFWDMVMLQVVQVNELFEQIEKLRSSQWQEVGAVCDILATPPPTKRPSKTSPWKKRPKEVKPTERPTWIPPPIFVNDKHVRFDSATISEPPRLISSEAVSVNPSEIFSLETRVCDDAFCVLTNSEALGSIEKLADGEACEIESVDNDPFLCESCSEIDLSENNFFDLTRCTPYIVNYVDVLRSDVYPFHFEELSRRPYSLFPREEVFGADTFKEYLDQDSKNFEVLFKKVVDENEEKDATIDYSDIKFQKEEDSVPKLTRENENKPQKNETNLPSRKTLFLEKKRETVRLKAKSCSPVRRAFKTEAKDCRRARSRTPERKLQKIDPIKLADEQSKSWASRPVATRKTNSGKVPLAQQKTNPPRKHASPSGSIICSNIKKQSGKKVGYSVTFFDDPKEAESSSKRISSGDCNTDESSKAFTKFESVLHGSPRRKVWSSCKLKDEKPSLPLTQTKMQAVKDKENHDKGASKAVQNDAIKGNLTVVSEVWSNIDSCNDKRRRHRKPKNAPESYTFSGSWTKKKRETKRDPPKKVEQKAEDPGETSDSVFWRLSDSKPFIPMSQETLRQLRQVYNTEHLEKSSALNKSEKIERMKSYDKRRKRILKSCDEESLRKLVSRGTTPIISEDNIAHSIYIQHVKSLNVQTNTAVTNDVDNFVKNTHDTSVQCSIPSSAMDAKDTSTLVVDNVRDSSTKWPERNSEIENLLSNLISSLNCEIIDEMPENRNSKLKNRVSIKRLSYGLVAETIEPFNTKPSPVVDISQPVHSDFAVRKKSRNVKSVNVSKYLSLRREFNVTRCLEDLKCVKLFPHNIQVPSSPSHARSFPVRMKRTYAFLRSNRTFCRLSLYLYIYGILSLVLLLLKIISCNQCFLDPRVLFNSY